MTNQSIAKFLVLTTGILSLPALSMAGTEMKESKEVKTVVEAAKESWISGDIGVDVVSQYVSRGSVLENQGFIAQPSINFYVKLYEGEGFINNITLYLQLWSSLHSENTDQGLVSGTGGSSTPAFYEFDYYPGFNITFAKNFTLSLGYAEFNYPNDGFFTQRLLQGKIAYNDADLLGAFAINPYFAYEYYLETPDESSYFEVGISPGFTVGSLKVNFPVKAGFGANGFYTDAVGNNQGFGYVSGGVAMSYPLAFIPEKFGTWNVSAGYTYYHLGEALEDFNTQTRGGAVRDADENEHVFSGGIRLAF